MATFSELFAQLDPDKNVKGKQFERICKWYLEHDRFYADQLTDVWLWKDWDGHWYPKREAGIDLVAQHRDGTLWAIQAKAYDHAYSVTKGDVDKFLSESNRKDKTGRPLFSFRLLLATTRKQLGSTAKNTVDGQLIPVGYRGHTDLDAAEIDWPASPSNLRARRLPPKEAKGHWAYQREAVNKVLQGFKHADRGKLIMACGTGKTLSALFIHEKLAAQRTLVLMPSLQLMKQTIGEWTRNKKVDFEYLPVCSDETVSNDDDDMPVSSTSDLGLRARTDPQEIATFLRRRSGPRVVFATYQSSPQIAKAFRLGRVPAFDLAIADEAHRCAAPHKSEFATILNNEKIKARRRLFMTATPRIYSASVKTTAKEAGFEFASMDDEEKFGKVFHRLSFREAIERGLLTDYRVAVIGVDNATYRDWAEKGWFITIDGKEVRDARTVAGQIGLAKAMRGYNLRRVITFHRLRKDAKKFSISLPEVIDWMPTRQRPNGRLWTDYVDGTMSAGERQRRLQRLGAVGDSERGLISNARCLTEGIDVPTLDGVAFIDPRRSEIDIAQAVGRAIRLADSKAVGTIVIPVFVDTDEPNPDGIIDNSPFKPVWDVLLALKAHDEELAQQLDDLRRMLGQLRSGGRGSLRLPPKIKVDVPNVLGAEFANAFTVLLVEETTSSWEESFGVLKRYVEENGDVSMPANYTVNGYPLFRWVITQRHKWERLSVERRQRLQDLPGWSLTPSEDKWERGFRMLLAYVKENGDALVPQDCEVEGYPLGAWCSNQRGAYRRGTLSVQRRRRLDAISSWLWNAREERWERGFRHLQEYLRANGNSRVHLKYKTVDGYPLGAWVNTQRSLGAQGNLETDRIKRLEEISDWSWNRREAKWDDAFRRLCEYAEANGHTQVPYDDMIDGFKLGLWTSNQRQRWDKLSAERQRRLKELPGWTEDSFKSRWEEGFQRMVDYVNENGDSLIPQSYVIEGYPLGSWAMTQRQHCKKGTLAPDRLKKLADVPGWEWNQNDARWEQGFRRLVEYAEANGNTCPTTNCVTDAEYQLGFWCANQRAAHRRGQLQPERAKRLSKLPFWEWDPPRGALAHRR